MPESDEYSARHELLEALMAKIDADVYPSTTMLDMIESLLGPDDVPAYAESLLTRIRNDQFPSVSLMQRVQNLA